jgi:Flp pilus assembly protein TadD
VLEIDPEDATAHANLGLVLMLSGRRREAAEHLSRAKELRGRQPVF